MSILTIAILIALVALVYKKRDAIKKFWHRDDVTEKRHEVEAKAKKVAKKVKEEAKKTEKKVKKSVAKKVAKVATKVADKANKKAAK